MPLPILPALVVCSLYVSRVQDSIGRELGDGSTVSIHRLKAMRHRTIEAIDATPDTCETGPLEELVFDLSQAIYFKQHPESVTEGEIVTPYISKP